jgi:hypothetical protein
MSYLFVLGPNRSGTSILSKIIASSPNVSSLPYEGHHMNCWKGFNQKNFSKAGVFTLDEKILSLEESYDWICIKQCFENYWEQKPIKHQKTPSDLCRVNLMEKHFNPCYWIANIRNPFSNALSIIKLRPERTVSEIGIHLNRCYEILEKQIQKKNVVLFKYEDLCDSPEKTTKKILDFMPTIEKFDFNFKTLSNKNCKAESLSKEFKKEIIEKIKPSLKFLEDCGYSKMF